VYSKIILLGLVTGASFCGVSAWVTIAANLPQPDRELALPQAWKVQAVEMPKMGPSALQELKLAGVKDWSEKNLGCDCMGCRELARTYGVKLN
jgi:hypothetical protein